MSRATPVPGIRVLHAHGDRSSLPVVRIDRGDHPPRHLANVPGSSSDERRADAAPSSARFTLVAGRAEGVAEMPLILGRIGVFNLSTCLA